MKNLVIAFAVISVLVLCSAGAFAAEQSLMLDPFSLIHGDFDVRYERAIGSRSSWLIDGSLNSADDGYWHFSGFGLDIGRRRYFEHAAPEGFFVGESFGIYFLDATYDDGWDYLEGSAAAVSFTMSGGYKWVSEDGFSTELVAGLSALTISAQADGETDYVEGYAPVLGLKVGYTW